MKSVFLTTEQFDYLARCHAGIKQALKDGDTTSALEALSLGNTVLAQVQPVNVTNVESRRQVLSFIQDRLERAHDLPPGTLGMRIRTGKIAEVRGMFCWLARSITDCSLVEVGAFIRRDHGTVLHWVGRMRDLMATEPNFKASLQKMESDFRAALNIPAASAPSRDCGNEPHFTDVLPKRPVAVPHAGRQVI